MAQATIEVTGREAIDPIAAIEYCYQQGWTDGSRRSLPTSIAVVTTSWVWSLSVDGASLWNRRWPTR
jgi:hypothetical protein